MVWQSREIARGVKSTKVCPCYARKLTMMRAWWRVHYVA